MDGCARQPEAKGNPCFNCQQPAITHPLSSAEDILFCVQQFRDKRQEYLITLSIDTGGRLIKRRIVTIGLLDTSMAHPREVFSAPIAEDGVCSIILVHNHPSGQAEPSKADIKTTQQLIAAGILLGVRIQDHFIVTKTEYFSFLEQGLISEEDYHYEA
jgi:DNA repair protein RadC